MSSLTFFSEPIFSFLVVYCPFNVAMNHFSTRSMRSCSVVPSEMDANSAGCSHQYAGNSVSEMGERMTICQSMSSKTEPTRYLGTLTRRSSHAGEIPSHARE